jgi:hypothetical protein
MLTPGAGMNICPLCYHGSSPAAEICEHCHKHRFRGGAILVESSPSSHALPTRANGSLSTITQKSNAVKNAELLRSPPPFVQYNTPAPPTRQMNQATQVQHPLATPIRVILKPRLEVVRGERVGVSFAILEGKNIIGRTVHQPADIDLTGLERPEQVWSSRQHAVITFDGQAMILEDLKSLNGTFVNRVKIHPGQQRVLQPNDIVQIGTVQLRVIVVGERVDGE